MILKQVSQASKGTRLLEEAKPQSDSELAPTAVHPLKSGACGEEGSAEK